MMRSALFLLSAAILLGIVVTLALVIGWRL